MTSMITGTSSSPRTVAEAMDRIRLAMAAGNFHITGSTDDRINFEHGSLLTQSASMLPKRGRLSFQAVDGGCEILYEVENYGFAKYWLIAVAIIFCWAIFPPILAYRALRHHPARLMQNLLQAGA